MIAFYLKVSLVDLSILAARHNMEGFCIKSEKKMERKKKKTAQMRKKESVMFSSAFGLSSANVIYFFNNIWHLSRLWYLLFKEDGTNYYLSFIHCRLFMWTSVEFMQHTLGRHTVVLCDYCPSFSELVQIRWKIVRSTCGWCL